MPTNCFGHLDMDAFYASVEILDRPELVGKPVVVGGASSRRGVIAAASYEARRYGVHSAMPTAQALRLCPQLLLLPGRMDRYQQISRRIMTILREVAPAVEPLSLDEAFLDLSGCERLYPSISRFAHELQQRIRRETGLWSSIGIGETRRIAKIASDLRKPRGVVIVEQGSGADFLAPLPISRLWGVGPRLQERLERMGFHRAGDIARTPRADLRIRLGKVGLVLHDMVHACERGRVVAERGVKSVSHEVTFARDRQGVESLLPVLMSLCEKVAYRMRRKDLQGRVVRLKLRDRHFDTVQRQLTLSGSSDDEREIYEASRSLLQNMNWEKVPVRLLGVGVSALSTARVHQGELFASRSEISRPRLNRILDAVHDRFGVEAIGRATGLMDRERHPRSEPWPHNPFDSPEVFTPLVTHEPNPSRTLSGRFDVGRRI